MTLFNFIGVDVSKDTFDVVLFQDAKPLHKIFNNQLAGFKAFVTWIQKHTQRPWVCMEATGHYSERLADFLCAQSLRVSVVNPLQIKQFAKMSLARHKNDKVDAALIARYASAFELRLFTPRPAIQKDLRELIQLADILKHQRVQLKNQFQSCQSASAKKAVARELSALEKRIKGLDTKTQQAVAQHEPWQAVVELLVGIKGIGALTACRLLAYLPDISFFKNAKQLASFVGLSPKQKTSGKYVGKTCLSKMGSPQIRTALYMPALSAVRSNKPLQPFVERLKLNGLKPKAIVGAMMRKLIHIIFGMLKNNQPFNPLLV